MARVLENDKTAAQDRMETGGLCGAFWRNAMTKDKALAIIAAHKTRLRELGVGSLSLFGTVLHQDVAPGEEIRALVEFSWLVGLHVGSPPTGAGVLGTSAA